jgi:hypothetical protein
VRLKPFSVPSMSVSMSGRKTRRGKGSSRNAGDSGGVGDIEIVGAGVGGVGSVRPKVERIDETRCQRLAFKVKVVATRIETIAFKDVHVTLEIRLTNLAPPPSRTTTPKNNPKTANRALSG